MICTFMKRNLGAHLSRGLMIGEENPRMSFQPTEEADTTYTSRVGSEPPDSEEVNLLSWSSLLWHFVMAA